jgi:epoxyqueuosine reductase
MSLTGKIKEKAREIGFDKVGITDTAPFSGRFKERYYNWLKRGYNAGLEYLRGSAQIRLNPESLFEGCFSIISVAINYFPGRIETPTGDEIARISRYALGSDYHVVIHEKLRRLLDFIKREVGGVVGGAVFCDDAPIFEKKIAERAGIGWIGKNCLLITKEYGSWVFLGEVVLDRELAMDKKAENLCGDCNLCVESCPTGAIVEPGTIDVSRCISYHTIESKEATPEEDRLPHGDRIFGCDACQEVCPFNSGVSRTGEDLFFPREEYISLTLENAWRVTLKEFKRFFRNSQIGRVGKEKLLNNIIIAMGNSGNRRYLPLIESVSREFGPIIEEQAEWAIEKIEKRHKT